MKSESLLEALLKTVDRINADPIFMHDVEWVAVYGSYITDRPDLGDVDVAAKLRARWSPEHTEESDFTVY